MDLNHLKASNLEEKVYKTSLTTKSHEQDDELLSFVIVLSVYSY